MSLRPVSDLKFFKPAFGAALAVLSGLALWQMPLGERCVNASYDYLFRFGARAVTNQVVLILMDNEAYARSDQLRGKPWERALHTNLLNKLIADGCSLVVFDVFLRNPGNPATDEALAEAMRRHHGRVVLMAEQAGAAHPSLTSARPTLPSEPFLSAAGTNWGVAWLDPDLDLTVRRHWPFPAPGPYDSLPGTAARLAGARLSPAPQEQWLRYYGPAGAWTSLSYPFALTQATNYFRGKVVFIGSKPETTVPDDGEVDEFRTPYTRWTGESAGGVELMATAFLNLMNGDWLRRPAAWVEAAMLVATGLLLGGGLGRVRWPAACLLASGAALAVTLGAVSWSHFSNYWFPWLVIAGGQVPCALAWALLAPTAPRERPPEPETAVMPVPLPAPPIVGQDLPVAPDYELFDPPFAEGAYGKVWLVRNAIGQWQALKAVYQAKFGTNVEPYDREFRGIQRYKPISDKHPGLLRVDFVSTKKPEGYFYYVMELGDARTPGWENHPATYQPLDLASVRAQSEGKRLPIRACVRIVLALAEALDFIHRQGLTHRDIKPRNIIFVNGQPKLADVGLVGEIRPPGQESTWVGTLGFMPPPPEPPGTPLADIYGLGMVLYLISTGCEPEAYPEHSKTFIERMGQADFSRLNAIILKACQPDGTQRYASAAEMRAALQEVLTALDREAKPDRP